MPAASLALGAGQRMLCVGLRMQKHRKVAAHLAKAEREHLVGRRSDDDIILFGDRQPEQAVAHGTTNLVDLHGSIIP